ncbi:MAG: FAD-dependent oxidoreductase [Rickettsiales bacterium]|nr:FAD-dependent oxidoreductase [Rickettsiales bacterium]
MEKKSVAIIGAGIAGLTLAHLLKGHADVTVFEKSRGLGGRMSTRYAGDYEFDHGAQFFIAQSKEFKQFIAPMIKAGVIETWNAGFVEFQGNEVNRSRQWNDKFPHYVGAPKMNAIGKYLAQDLNVYTQTCVDKLQKRGTKWDIIGENEQELGLFDWVISTAPAQQSTKLLPSEFQYHSTMQDYPMVGCYTLMLGFDEPLDLDWQAALVRQSDISWMSVNSSKPGRSSKFSLSILATNVWSEENMDRDRDEVVDHLMAQASQVSSQNLKVADHIALHSWRYENSPKRLNKEPLLDEQNQLGVCGDWCQQGRVEGAFTSARYLANSLKTHLK